ncbi:hypothetical protein [Sorangium sp. So ce131]|uniref:hypothetical protein n=1 Tax=Sorangium sp. So ce131 TaxID=3133282 RepID=UPI003F63DEA1
MDEGVADVSVLQRDYRPFGEPDSATRLAYWRLTDVDYAGRFREEAFGNGIVSERSYYADTQRLKSVLTQSGQSGGSTEQRPAVLGLRGRMVTLGVSVSWRPRAGAAAQRRPTAVPYGPGILGANAISGAAAQPARGPREPGGQGLEQLVPPHEDEGTPRNDDEGALRRLPGRPPRRR